MNDEAMKRCQALGRDYVAKLSALKMKAAQEFFLDPGLPDAVGHGLMEGWNIYQERRREREKVGAPLPPGGVFCLGYPAVIAQAKATAHERIAGFLGIGVDAVAVRVENARLLANIQLPDGWPLESPISEGARMARRLRDQSRDGQEWEKMISAYLKDLVEAVNGWFWPELDQRMAHADEVRSEVL